MSLVRPKITPIPTIDHRIAVNNGLVPGHSIVSKFADNPDMSSDVLADIWDYPAEEIYTFSDSNAIDTISSSNSGDGIEMVIDGLAFGTWERIVQVVKLNGQDKVALPTPLIRHNRAFNGNGIPLSGNVYVYEDTPIVAGVPTDTSKVRGYVSMAENQTLQGIYTTPAGVTGFFLGLTASMSKPVSTSTVIITGKARAFEKVFRTQVRFALQSVGSSHVGIASTGYSAFPEKTDFVASGVASANNVGVSITFDLEQITHEFG